MMHGFVAFVKLRLMAGFIQLSGKDSRNFHRPVLRLDNLDRIVADLQTGSRLGNVLQMFEYQTIECTWAVEWQAKV